MVGLERCEDGLDVLICLFAGQAAVIRAQNEVERHALLADSHAGAAVNIEQRHILEKALRAAAVLSSSAPTVTASSHTTAMSRVTAGNFGSGW